jgi:hypothetical protein
MLPCSNCLACPTGHNVYFDFPYAAQFAKGFASFIDSRRCRSLCTFARCSNVDYARSTILIFLRLLGCEDVNHPLGSAPLLAALYREQRLRGAFDPE